ncbi:MAG: hypothetical protein QXS20_03340 [Candidatus Thorarchaeota archaeon]
MYEVFEVDEAARLSPAEACRTSTDSTKVLIYVDHDSKTIFLWRGERAPLATKLMGTRVASTLSHKYPSYRIRPISEGKEPAAFKDLLGIKRI